VDTCLVLEDGYIKELTEPGVEGSLLSIAFLDKLSLKSVSCGLKVQKSSSYELKVQHSL
jgi:hypothetical protein